MPQLPSPRRRLADAWPTPRRRLGERRLGQSVIIAALRLAVAYHSLLIHCAISLFNPRCSRVKTYLNKKNVRIPKRHRHRADECQKKNSQLALATFDQTLSHVSEF